jgi:glycosyltransferase involved in cell wall biosynthesis
LKRAVITLIVTITNRVSKLKVNYATLYSPQQYLRPFLAEKALGKQNIAVTYISAKKHLRSLKSVNNIVNYFEMFSSLSRGILADGTIILNPYPLGRVLKYSLSCRKPYIVDYMDVFLDKDFKIPLAHKKVLEGANGIIFWSKAFMDRFGPEFDGQGKVYIPSGADLSLFQSMLASDDSSLLLKDRSNEEKTVMYFGLLWRRSGQDVQGIGDLIQAMAIVERELGNVRLVLDGVTPDKQLLEVVEKSGIKNISFPERKPYGSAEMLDRLRSSDVLVLPTTSYPTISFAEQHKVFTYMAAKRPIVATDTPGTHGVLDDTSALFAEPESSVSLASAILKALTNSQLAASIADKSYQRLIEYYSWDKLALAYNDFVVKCFSD